MLHYEQQLLQQRAPKEAQYLANQPRMTGEEVKHQVEIQGVMTGVRSAVSGLFAKTKSFLTKERSFLKAQEKELSEEVKETTTDDTPVLVSHPDFHRKTILMEMLDAQNTEGGGVTHASERSLAHLQRLLATNGALVRNNSVQVVQDLYSHEPAMKDIINKLFAEIYPNNPGAEPSIYLEKIMERLEIFAGKPVTEILETHREEQRREKLLGGIALYCGDPLHQKKIAAEYTFDRETQQFVLSRRGEKMLRKYMTESSLSQWDAILVQLANAGKNTVAPLSLREKAIVVQKYTPVSQKKSLWNTIRSFGKSTPVVTPEEQSLQNKESLYARLNHVAYQTAEELLGQMNHAGKKITAEDIEYLFANVRYQNFIAEGLGEETNQLKLLDIYVWYMREMANPYQQKLQQAYSS